MEIFDLYYAWNDELSKIKPGAVVELDGCDGFFDQYFDGCPDQIRFIVLNTAIIPDTQASFETLPFIEAKVRKRNHAGANVEILNLQSFGTWATEVRLPKETAMNELPQAYQLPKQVFLDLVNQAGKQNWAIWKARGKNWHDQDHANAICVFTTPTDMRCIIFADNAAPSLLFRIGKEFSCNETI